MPVEMRQFCKGGFPNKGSNANHKGHNFKAYEPFQVGARKVQIWKSDKCSVKIYLFSEDTGYRWNVNQGYFQRMESAFDMAIKCHNRAMLKARKLLKEYGDILERTGIDLFERYQKGELGKLGETIQEKAGEYEQKVMGTPNVPS